MTVKSIKDDNCLTSLHFCSALLLLDHSENGGKNLLHNVCEWTHLSQRTIYDRVHNLK